jgi:hypothetical protein
MFSARETVLDKPLLAEAGPVVSEKADPMSSWFRAAEDLGEYIGIRFGQILPGKTAPDWYFLPHTEGDGIGGFAELLRARGAHLPRLPQIRHPALPSAWRLSRTWATYAAPRRAVKFGEIEGKPGKSSSTQPPQALAWHVFDEETTIRVRRLCRRQHYTVNSFLLKSLTKAIRPSLLDESSVVPWMVPVNMRGKVVRERDTANFSSYIGVKVRSYESTLDIHQNIYRALGRAEHWANWYAYQSGKFLGSGLKRALIKSERCTSQWSIGAFSNLGDWDGEKQISSSACTTPWLFCPPVLRIQLVGAGVVTFQNRLSLTIQAHPELTTSSNTLWIWIQNWVKEIQIDLASVFPDAHSAS